jgi:hypothetical protein
VVVGKSSSAASGASKRREVGLPRAVVAMPRGKERSGSVEVLGTKWHDVHVLDQ